MSGGRGLMVAFVAVAIVGGAACSSDEEERAPAGQPPDNPAYVAVCRAVAAVRSDDAAGARTIFENEAHGPLHELSDRADEEDRSAAARLLEAKQAVEQVVAEGGDASALRAPLERLSAATADAAGAVEREQGPCPG